MVNLRIVVNVHVHVYPVSKHESTTHGRDQVTVRIVVDGTDIYLICLADGEDLMSITGFIYSDSSVA